MQQHYDDYAQQKQQLQEEADSLRASLDGGNTNQLVDSVLNMGFGLSKQDSILRRNSPLSDGMMAAVILEDVYGGEAPARDMLRDLLVMNVPLQARTIRVARLPEVGLNGERMDSVMSAQTEGPFDSVRTGYVDTMGLAKRYDSKMRQVANSLRFWKGYRDMQDTLGTSTHYKTYLRNDSSLTSKKQLTDLLLDQDSITEAEAVLDTVWQVSGPEDSIETQWFADYVNLMIEIGDSIYSMDSTQTAEMYDIAESGSHVAPKAQAVLLMTDSASFNYPIEKIENTSSKWVERNEIEETAPQPQVEDTSDQLQFKLYPNPNSGMMTLEYTLNEKRGKMTMFDVTGRQILEKRLQEGSHQIRVEPGEVSSGMYIYKITSDKEQLHQGKVVIMR